MNMTSLEMLLQDNAISLYRVSMIMNGNQSHSGRWGAKIKGEKSISLPELRHLLLKINRSQGISLNLEDVDFDVDMVKVR